MSIAGSLNGFLDREDWVKGAVCSETDPEIFHPEKGGSTRPAKAICGGCPVRAQCLQYALEHNEQFGVWGGLSERDRREFKTRKPVTHCVNRHEYAVTGRQVDGRCPECSRLRDRRYRQRRAL